MSLNNSMNYSNKSLNSIGIPSIFFKNKSILNFNQLSTIPKTKCITASNNLCENKNMSLYNEKMNYRIKRTVLTNQNYTEDQKIHGFKIVESNKRKINDNGNSIIKKVCNEKNAVSFLSDNASNVDPINKKLLMPKSKKVKNLTSSNCIDNVDKEFNLRDKSFLQNVQQIDKTTNCFIDEENKNESLLQENVKMIIDNSRSQRNENKIIQLNLLDATQSSNNSYKAKSVSQLLTQIDNHRLSCSKKHVTGCLTFEKRFENIKALLSSDTNRSDNKGCLISSVSNHISKYPSQLNNSNSNSAIVLNKLPKVEISVSNEDLNKNCQNDILTEKVDENVTKIINDSLNKNSVIFDEKTDKKNEMTKSGKLQTTSYFNMDLVGKDNCKSTTLIEGATIPKNVSKAHDNIHAKENNESKFLHLESNSYDINNGSQSKASVLSLTNEKDFRNLESGKNSIIDNSSSNKCDNGINQLKYTNFVNSFGKTFSDNQSNSQVALSNNQTDFITTNSFGKTDQSNLVKFPPMSDCPKSHDSTVTSTSFSFGSDNSTVSSLFAPASSNVFGNSSTISKSSIFDSSSFLTCSLPDNFSGKSHSNSILFNKSTSSNNTQSISSQPLAMSIPSVVSVNGLFSQSVLSPATSNIQIDNNRIRSEFSRNVISESAFPSSAPKMSENKTNIFISKSGQSNIINKTETQSNMFSFGGNVTSNNFSLSHVTSSNGNKDDKSSLFSFGQNHPTDINNSLPFTSISTNNTIPSANNLQQFNGNKPESFQMTGFNFNKPNETSYFDKVTNPMSYQTNQQSDIEIPKTNTLPFSKSASNNFVFGQSFNEVKPISNNNNEFARNSNVSSGYLNNTSFSNTFAQGNPFDFGNTKNVDPNSSNNPFAFGSEIKITDD